MLYTPLPSIEDFWSFIYRSCSCLIVIEHPSLFIWVLWFLGKKNVSLGNPIPLLSDHPEGSESSETCNGRRLMVFALSSNNSQTLALFPLYKVPFSLLLVCPFLVHGRGYMKLYQQVLSRICLSELDWTKEREMQFMGCGLDSAVQQCCYSFYGCRTAV